MIALIGGEGSIGRRYAAILRYFDMKYVVVDPVREDYDRALRVKVERAIVCTPTAMHYQGVKWCMEKDIPILCEKPLSINQRECFELGRYKKGFVVNNYQHVFQRFQNEKFNIKYNYYNTGKDGVAWDCCQLIYMDPKVEIRTDSPILTIWVNNSRITHENIERGYMTMIRAFMAEEKEKLWTFAQGMEMTEAVYAYLNRNTVKA